MAKKQAATVVEDLTVGNVGIEIDPSIAAIMVDAAIADLERDNSEFDWDEDRAAVADLAALADEIDNTETDTTTTGGEDDEMTVTPPQPREIKFLRPEQLVILPEYDVRPFKNDGDDENEARKIEALAKAIDEDGQQDDAIAAPVKIDGKEVYALLAGSRRKRAISLINETRSRNALPLLKVRVAIDRTGQNLLKKAWDSNDKRRQPNVLDLALLCQTVREQHHGDSDWAGFKGAKKLALMFGKSAAEITQAEKILLSGDAELHRMIATGQIKAQAAFELLNTKTEKRPEVIERAKDIELEKGNAENTREVEKTVKSSVTGESKTVKDVEPKKIGSDSIRKAQREIPESVDKPTPLNRKEILEYFETKDGPMYGALNSATRKWIAAFVNEYVTGKMAIELGDAQKAENRVNKLFDKMVEFSDKGTPGKSETEDDKLIAPKTASGRAQRRDLDPKSATQANKAAAKVAGKKAATKKSSSKTTAKAVKKAKKVA